MDINSKDFFDTYVTVLTKDQFNRLEDFTLGIIKTLHFTDEETIDLDSRLKTLNDLNQKLYRTASRNNQGIVFEKTGDLANAIKVYEENISEGYPATHSFIRLMVIYRKLKKHSEEIRVIDQGLSIMKDKNPGIFAQWSKRLVKAKNLAAYI